MTTRGLNQEAINKAIAAAQAAAKNARDRREALQKRSADLVEKSEAAQRNIRILGAVERQRTQDDLAEVGEELGQFDVIFGNGTEEPPQPPSTPDDPGLLTHGQPDPPAPADGGDDVPEPPARRSNADPRNWGSRPWPWILAIIGAIIGAVIARVSYDPMWSFVTVSGWHTLLVILWFIALIAAGFFSGGAIGCTIDERRGNNRQH